MAKMRRAAILGLVVAVFALGCQDEQVDGESNQDAGEDEPRELFEIDDPYGLVPFQDGVDKADGHPDVNQGIPADDEVRVGRIHGEETGFSGIWSHCREGDFVLENSEIAICVQEESTNRLETYTGGKLVDVRRQGDEEAGDQVLDLIMPLVIDLATASARSVEVVRDGTDGVAVLRVTGRDIDIAQITGVTSNRWHDSSGLRIQSEYRLEPGSSAVEMVSVYTPPLGQTRNHQIGDWFAYGDRAQAWTPGVGLGLENEEMPWVGAFGDGYSFGLVFEGTAAPLGLADQFYVPWAEMRVEQLEMTSEEPGVYRRWFAVGDGTLDSVRTLAAELSGESLEGTPTEISVVDAASEPIEDARVVVFDGDEAITAGYTDATGSVELLVDDGTYRAEIREVAGPLEFDEEIAIDGDPVTIELPEFATVEFEVREAATDELISARVTFEDDDYGSWFQYAIGGTLTTRVPATELTTMVNRGMEYDLYRQPVDYSASTDEVYSVELVRGLDTDGWRSGDFHQHLEPSFDSRLHVDTRVKENVTQGVELAVPTDHDIVSDIRPAIERLGVGSEISSFPGVEISPLYAHFNLYPVPYEPSQRGRGTIPLAELDTDGELQMPRMPEIVETARGFSTDPVVQMNHPRNDSGMMNHVGFDPESHPDEETHDDFAIDIDTIEVINRYGDVCSVLADWSGLLNAGMNVTGLGNSDSHDPDAEAGVPRNYLTMDLEPGDIDADTTRQVLRDGQVTVASHAFIDFTDGTLPGDEIDVGDDHSASFELRVQTPDWAHAERLHVIVNGSVVDTIERSAEDGARADFEETIDVEVDEDSWIVFWAEGPEPTAPVPRSKDVISFTNPVFLNVDGDSWQAPGPRSLDLDPIGGDYCG